MMFPLTKFDFVVRLLTFFLRVVSLFASPKLKQVLGDASTVLGSWLDLQLYPALMEPVIHPAV